MDSQTVSLIIIVTDYSSTGADQSTVVSLLGNASNITIFAPNNQAFEAASSALEALQATPDAISALLTYHVANGSLMSAGISETPTFLPTLLANETYTNVTGGQVVGVRTEGENAVVTSGLGGTANVTTTDIAINNGSTVHIIDSVLAIPQNLYMTAVMANLTALAGALNATNLTEPLNAASDITVFAPTTAAFEDISSALANLTAEDAAGILGYHVINGTVAYSSLLGNVSVPSSTGQDLNITVIDGAVFVNAARVIATDVLVANGVVHVIDAVLNPNSTLTPDPANESPVVQFQGATDEGEVAYTSGLPAATTAFVTTTANVAEGYTAIPTEDLNSLTEGAASGTSSAGAAKMTGAVAAAVLFGAAGFAAQL